MSSKQHYLVIDLDLCFNCNNCRMACMDEHVGNDWKPYTESMTRHHANWIESTQKVRGQAPRIDACYLVKPCQHCENAECMKAYPDQVYRREDGIVLIDPEKARGNKDLVNHCPYHAMSWNEELQVAQKCTMCAHILDSDQQPCMPRCAHSCPTESLKHYFITPEEMDKMIKDEELEELHPQLGSKPHVFYKNLYRFTKNFITGCILKDNDCVEGAEVVLNGEGVVLDQKTDYFGEFKFDKLEPGTYTIEVNGKPMKSVTIAESLDAGPIEI
ncbi:MAG: oxidoreductase [Eubacterium sp.]|nr:oxidoreductase [Eubacterium sp.]